MGKYIDAEKLNAEIERRMKIYKESNYGISLRYQELEELLSFISTLESEKPLGLEEEIERYLSTKWELDEDLNKDEPIYIYDCTWEDLKILARHFAEWGYLRAAEKYDEIEYNRQMAEEHLADARKTSSNDLALTWEDIESIVKIADSLLTGTAWDAVDWPDEQKYYEEVLKRFKEARRGNEHH